MNLFAANWKMNMTRAEAAAYARELGGIVGTRKLGVELVVAPPFTALDAAKDPGGRWSVAGQNVASEASGAYTGEVSAKMLADAGCRYVIVGHSERRRIYGEDGKTLARKLARVREAGLVPIYCLGETEAQREEGLTATTLVSQVETLANDPPGDPLVVAYEPVWAIGTGRAATVEDCRSARVHLADLLSNRRDLRILYGGSVTAENCAALLTDGRADGFLVGGASLKAASFAAIAGVDRLAGSA
ncbi:MAG TPA: triose-phosphate isomerase [Thermoanaerobaculia bacterium]|nr:triose-phosphate isomerase [Thermoanaerobaculia bacterium]